MAMQLNMVRADTSQCGVEHIIIGIHQKHDALNMAGAFTGKTSGLVFCQMSRRRFIENKTGQIDAKMINGLNILRAGEATNFDFSGHGQLPI
jgi:hypothetical protein